MTQENKNSLTIIFVLIVVAGLFIILNKNKNPEIVSSPDEESITQGEEGLNEEKSPEGISAEINIDQDLQVKFNKALSNGSIAFSGGDYNKAINYFKEALSYRNADAAHIRLFYAYSASNQIDKATSSIESAIKLNSSLTEYWTTKLVFLDEKTEISFSDLKKIYEEGLTKVDSRTKVNLVTTFAVISEKNHQDAEAIAGWAHAKILNPDGIASYQAEIDRLSQ